MDLNQSVPLSGELNHWINTGSWGHIASYLSDLKPDQYDAHTYLAKGLLLMYGPAVQRNIDQAVESLESACRLEPDELQYLNTFAETLLQAKQFQKALSVAQNARKIDPMNAMAAVTLGRAAWACRNRILAYQSFQDALHLLPNDSSPVRQQVNTTALKLAPFWWSSLEGRGVTLVRMGAQHHDFILQCRNDSTFQGHYNLFQKTTSECVKRDIKLSDLPPLENINPADKYIG